MKIKYPLPFEVVRLLIFVPWLVITIVAPDTIAPVESATVPLTSAVAPWARREEAERRSTITSDRAVIYEERITILLKSRTGDLTVGRFVRLRPSDFPEVQVPISSTLGRTYSISFVMNSIGKIYISIYEIIRGSIGGASRQECALQPCSSVPDSSLKT